MGVPFVAQLDFRSISRYAAAIAATLINFRSLRVSFMGVPFVAQLDFRSISRYDTSREAGGLGATSRDKALHNTCSG